ncbi:DUF4232 domain-containing protein [Streptomyces sp. M19]
MGAGNIHYSLVFTNNGSKSCVLRGYPESRCSPRTASPSDSPPPARARRAAP